MKSRGKFVINSVDAVIRQSVFYCKLRQSKYVMYCNFLL